MILIQDISDKTIRRALSGEFAQIRRERGQEIEKVAAVVGAYPETIDRVGLGATPPMGLSPVCSNIITKTSKSNSSTVLKIKAPLVRGLDYKDFP